MDDQKCYLAKKKGYLVLYGIIYVKFDLHLGYKQSSIWLLNTEIDNKHLIVLQQTTSITLENQAWDRWKALEEIFDTLYYFKSNYNY